ncbi:MAG TPA: hypothetical protein VGC95_04805 [Chitinophagaceae bacterium]
MWDNKLRSYLRAGILLHVITVVEIGCFTSLFCFADMDSWFSPSYSFLKYIAFSPSVGMPLFAQLDARSRYQNYKLIKDNLYRYGFQKRILRPFIKSRCQRDAIRAAAMELGMLDVCRDFFRTQGYRWYHMLPDVVFDQPSVLLTKNFWVTTLFEKNYQPKHNYQKLEVLLPAA